MSCLVGVHCIHKNSKTSAPPVRFVYKFKNANFNEIRSELSLTDFSNVPNVDSSWNNFTDIFISIINKHISKINQLTEPLPGLRRT